MFDIKFVKENYLGKISITMLDQELRDNFANNIQKLRKARNMSQQQLGEALSYSDKAVSKWETGETIPDAISLLKIAAYLNVTVDDLFSRNNVVKISHRNKNRILITASSCGLAFFLMLIAFLVLSIVKYNGIDVDSRFLLLCFPCGFAVASIVWIVFAALWFEKIWLLFAITTLIWSGILISLLFVPLELSWIMIALGLVGTIIAAVFIKIEK